MGKISRRHYKPATARPLRRYYNIMRLQAALIALLFMGCGSVPEPPDDEIRYHSPPGWTRPEMKEQHRYTIPSCVVLDDGRKVDSADDWYRLRRPELLCH